MIDSPRRGHSRHRVEKITRTSSLPLHTHTQNPKHFWHTHNNDIIIDTVITSYCPRTVVYPFRIHCPSLLVVDGPCAHLLVAPRPLRQHLGPHGHADLFVAGQPRVPPLPVVVHVVALIVQHAPLVQRGREPQLVVVPAQRAEQARARGPRPLPLGRVFEPAAAVARPERQQAHVGVIAARVAGGPFLRAGGPFVFAVRHRPRARGGHRLFRRSTRRLGTGNARLKNGTRENRTEVRGERHFRRRSGPRFSELFDVLPSTNDTVL